MRTALISDLHLGVASDEDVLRHPAIREVLLEEIAGADRLVLLGDVVELRNLPLGPSLERSRPFFEALGEVLGQTEVTFVPGNHDARFAEPLLDRLSLGGDPVLGLEHTYEPLPPGNAPSPGPAELLDEWLGPARLEFAYPGVWLRDDVYATHGHYVDAHLRLPRAECLAAATMARLLKPPPPQATPGDYERILRPLYGFAYGLAQVLPARRRRNGPGERAWEILNGEAKHLSWRARLGRASFAPAIHGLNRLLRSDFDPDVTAAAIFRSGVDAATELAVRLGRSRANPSGPSPAAAASTTPAAGSSPPPFTTPDDPPALTGREPSPGSRTTPHHGGWTS
jgi:hypothetical protein